MIIRDYEKNDEVSWLRCRVLSFLDTAYYDHVLIEKEHYDNPSIELIAAQDNIVIGFIDLELDTSNKRVCSNRTGLGGMVWHLGVHPDYRKTGIGKTLLEEAITRAKAVQIERLEAWTRDDLWVNEWYVNRGFQRIDSYLQVYMQTAIEIEGTILSQVPELYPVSLFAHYVGEDRQKIKEQFSRVHETNLYELIF